MDEQQRALIEATTERMNKDVREFWEAWLAFVAAAAATHTLGSAGQRIVAGLRMDMHQLLDAKLDAQIATMLESQKKFNGGA